MVTLNELERQRLAMVIEFDGSKFHGWQRQDNAFTAQEAMEDAIMKIEGENTAPQFAAAGRTDTGVHATHMLIHADVLLSMWQKSPQAYVKGLNFHLRDTGVLVHGVKAVTDEFHARFDCFERRYQYKIWNRSVSSVLHKQHAWWVFQPMDVAKMNQAAAMMVGRHDFTTFRAAGCQANASNRNLKVLEVKQEGHIFTIDVAADAFLYHMVRNLVGTLVAVGIGRWEPEYMYELLMTKNRCIAAQTAPAHGLYFTDALYPDFSAQEISGMVG
ncbi:MAG: tRNA pseudouridine(38-40) synthase TruA [Ghiorsea sp.]